MIKKEINGIKFEFENKKLYEAVSEAAQRLENDGFEITKLSIEELDDFFKKMSEKLKISYSKTLELCF